MKTLLLGTPLVVALLCSSPVGLRAQDRPEVEIILHEGTSVEEQARRQLRRLLDRYDLSPWIFTRDVLIQTGVRPHSHPILTLNTRYLEDDMRQLSVFVHEQAHWYMYQAEDEPREQAFEELRRLYPEVPVGGSEGARSEFSTYLHLTVCWLEWEAMVHLVGEETARKNYDEITHYRWIYRRVLDDGEAIGAIMKRHGLVIPTKNG